MDKQNDKKKFRPLKEVAAELPKTLKEFEELLKKQREEEEKLGLKADNENEVWEVRFIPWPKKKENEP